MACCASTACFNMGEADIPKTSHGLMNGWLMVYMGRGRDPKMVQFDDDKSLQRKRVCSKMNLDSAGNVIPCKNGI